MLVLFLSLVEFYFDGLNHFYLGINLCFQDSKQALECACLVQKCILNSFAANFSEQVLKSFPSNISAASTVCGPILETEMCMVLSLRCLFLCELEMLSLSQTLQ